MVLIRTFESTEWQKYRAVRLQALQESPDAFGRLYVDSAKYSDELWQARLERIDPASDFPLGAFTCGPAPGESPRGESTPGESTRGESVVGLAWGRIDSECPGRADLYQMWASPAYRGQGIGRRMLTEVISWARQQQAIDLYLGVTIDNSPAEQLYRSAGFESIGEPEPLRPHSSKLVQNMRLIL